MEKGMITKPLFASVIFLALYTLLFGLIYPGIVTLINHSLFPEKAKGSLIYQNGKIIGSEFLGQEFSDPKYFWSRPSATDFPYNPAASTGSNLSSANPLFIKNAEKRIQALQNADLSNSKPIPIDLITTSGSGLDPHISVAAALYQVQRVAKKRHLNENIVFELVKSSIEHRQFGFLGESRVNVVKLNIKLDQIGTTHNGTAKTRS